MSPRRRLALLGAAASLVAPMVALSGGAGPAAATGGDAIVYLKDGRVWIARMDASGARPFTTARYNWSSPSQDDHGNVVVLGGLARTNADGSDSDGSSEIYRFGPDGNQIGHPIPSWGSYSTPACPTYPPQGARVSPDGSKVAYGIFACGDSTYTTLWTPVTSTGLNFPNQTVGQEDFYEPSWVDGSHFVVSHLGMTLTDTQARWFVHDTSAGDDEGPGWHDDSVTGTGAQAVVSRDGTTMAVFSDDAADYFDGVPRNVDLFLYSAPDLATAEAGGWSLDCTVALDASATTDPFHLSPSIGPDGSKVYWGDDDGVEVAQIADRSDGCAGVHPVLLIPGGSQPFVGDGGLAAPAAEPIQPGAHYPPHADFRVVTRRPIARHAVRLDAGASHETLGRISGYRWTFGDRHSGSGAVVSHAYARPGSYRVRLTVVDRRGLKASTTRTVSVARR